MEISKSVVLRTRSIYCSGGGIGIRHRLSFPGGNQSVPRDWRCRRLKCCRRLLPPRMVSGDLCGGFKEKGHLEYYGHSVAPVYGEKEKEKKKAIVKQWSEISMKKRAKLLKGLAKDLSMFSELGFGLDSDEAKGKSISQAVEVLLAQLEHLRSEDKKRLKSRNHEMEKMKSPKMNMDDLESSSSSSSESSDSKREGKMVDMLDLRTTVPIQQPDIPGKTPKPRDQDTVVTSSNSMIVTSFEESTSQPQIGSPRVTEEVAVVDSSSQGSSMSNTVNQNGMILNGATKPAIKMEPLKRVEVCMGGKCKKLGAQILSDEFERVLGNEGSVLSCKCMGKCKFAPNVRVLNGEDEMVSDDSIRTPRNPLCLGVGLEDVELIVANYFKKVAMDAGVSTSTLASS